HPQPRRRHGLTSASTGVRHPYWVRRPTPGPGADAYGPGHDRGHTCAGVRAAILVARMPESPTGETPARCRKLALLLVRPSKYDDRGYVIRHWRGVLPSNTLNCLHALTLDAVRRGALDGIRVSVHVRDEAVHRVDPERLARKLLRPGVRGLVAL